MRLTCLGTGDAFGSGGRLNACFLLEAEGGTMLIDCGATALVSMRRFAVEPNRIERIVVSHLHGDHYGGLPSFLLEAQFVSRREAPLVLAGPPGFRDRLTAAMEALFPGSPGIPWRFPLETVELPAERPWTSGAFTVTPWEVRHPSGAPPYALRVEAAGRVLAYSGDTEWVEALVAVARGADLFLTECYAADKPVPYHLDLATLVAKLPEIGARRVVFTHMSRAVLRRLADLPCETADDGAVFEV